MDTLIAEGKALPMLVVMDQGYATRAGAAPAPAGQRGAGAGQPDAFQDVVLRDLIPTIDASYRTLHGSASIARLPDCRWAPGRRCRIGFGNPDVFASVGAFSGGGGGGRGGAPFDRQTAYSGAMADVAAFNQKFDLFWIGLRRPRGRIRERQEAARHARRQPASSTSGSFQRQLSRHHQVPRCQSAVDGQHGAVIPDAASEARNATAWTTSIGSTMRRSGYQRASWARISGFFDARSVQMGVRTVPGHTMFARML